MGKTLSEIKLAVSLPKACCIDYWSVTPLSVTLTGLGKIRFVFTEWTVVKSVDSEWLRHFGQRSFTPLPRDMFECGLDEPRGPNSEHLCPPELFNHTYMG
jgi:hypothetical protein